jgi:nitrite reductase/ring-hydroxylating ferredoxin subunit
MNGAWWAVALSESVQGTKALAVACGDLQLALFRNEAGIVCALEDRCPHRRVLLSPGVVTGGGLQCPYHGWTFDGQSGKCTDIPNLRRDEAVPAKYQALAFQVAESSGFIHVWLGEGIASQRFPSQLYRRRDEREFCGTAVVCIPQPHYLDVMLDGPQLLLRFPGVEITDAFLGDALSDSTHMVLDRGALWKGKGERSAFVRDHPLILRTRVPLSGGAIGIELLDSEEAPLVTVLVSAIANRRGTTSLCWRGFAHAYAGHGIPLRARLRQLAAGRPFMIASHLDGAAVAALEVAPSWDRQRAIERKAA